MAGPSGLNGGVLTRMTVLALVCGLALLVAAPASAFKPKRGLYTGEYVQTTGIQVAGTLTGPVRFKAKGYGKNCGRLDWKPCGRLKWLEPLALPKFCPIGGTDLDPEYARLEGNAGGSPALATDLLSRKWFTIGKISSFTANGYEVLPDEPHPELLPPDPGYTGEFARFFEAQGEWMKRRKVEGLIDASTTWRPNENPTGLYCDAGSVSFEAKRR